MKRTIIVLATVLLALTAAPVAAQTLLVPTPAPMPMYEPNGVVLDSATVIRGGSSLRVARLPLELPADVVAGAMRRLGITANDPTSRTEQRLVKEATEETPAVYEDVVIPLPTPTERVTAWAIKQLRDNLENELKAIKEERVEAIRPTVDVITGLDAEACKVINAALVNRGKAPLATCGGG